MYLQHMPAYMLGDIREVPIDKLKNALYGQPEDRRGEEDLVPSDEKTADVFNPKINKKTKSDYVGPQTSQVGGIGGVAADSEDVCECGHSREEHDGAGCFADPEKCQCTKQPGMFDGEKDEISKKKPNYLFVYGTLRQGEPYYEKYLKDSKFVRNVKTQPKYHLVVTQAAGMVEGESAVEGELYEVPDEVMAEIDKYEHPYFRQEIELEDGSTAYAYFVPEEVSEVVEEAPRMHSPASDVESSVFPSDKDDENLNTDPDETFENRDIRRDPLTERSKYAGRKT
jgi:gamma-glutamylcyclotransferase (GGCT)/AIG2-like uncharacterized protein YtfP